MDLSSLCLQILYSSAWCAYLLSACLPPASLSSSVLSLCSSQCLLLSHLWTASSYILTFYVACLTTTYHAPQYAHVRRARSAATPHALLLHARSWRAYAACYQPRCVA